MKAPKFTNLSFTAKLSGSTGAELFKNKSGKKWVVKKATLGGGFEQTRFEALADYIYYICNIPVPKHTLDLPSKALILEYIEGDELGKIKDDASQFEKAKAELQKGFIVDALLANRDVIGLHMDNILVPSDGEPAVRIDNGGSFMFRASGKKKEFGKVVSELDTMRNKNINPSAAAIFGDITDSEIDRQIKKIIVPNYKDILEGVEAVTGLFGIMKDRLDYLIERTVWFNSTRFKNNVHETAMPKYIQPIQEALVRLFFPGISNSMNAININKLNKILIENEAIISGGFLLKALGLFKDDKSVDIDIYVPSKNAANLMLIKNLFKATGTVNQVSSNTKDVFYKKNGIVSVTKYFRTKPEYAEIDIVEISDDRTPVDVIKNTDLTFCENWYDGKQLYMVHPEDVIKKSGFVENAYLGLLFKKNPILMGRIKKYIDRGFKVSIHNPSSKKVENITESIKNGTFLKGYNITVNTVNKKKSNNNGRHGTTILPSFSSPYITSVEPKLVEPSEKNVADLLPFISSEANNKVVPSNGLKMGMPSYKGKITLDMILEQTEDIVPPITNAFVNRWDIELIRYFTELGYKNINAFLADNTYTPKELPPKIYKALLKKFITTQYPSVYNELLIYYYFVNLYNCIQKTPPIDEPFMVVRGTKTWYIPTTKGKASYLNSFTSTTTDMYVATGFSSNNITYDNKMYLFYVHPLCQFMNIRSISSHRREKEILLNPYNKMCYIRTDGNKQVFVVLPTDLTIPDDYDLFIHWNTTHHSVTGGRVNINRVKTLKVLNVKRNFARNNTRKKLKSVEFNLKGKMNSNVANVANVVNTTTMKSNTLEYKNVSKEFIDRLNQPISTFSGKDISESEKRVIEQMVKYFEG
jgi:hypothetical protein